MGSRSALDYSTYFLCDTSLKVVRSHPHLGVQQQCSLKWDSHIEQIPSNPNQRLAMLRRVLGSANIPTKKIAYFSLGRPTLEYAFQIPLQKKNKVRQLEKIQNKALLIFFNIKGQISFSELRREVGIESLQERRLNARLSLFSRCIAEIIEPSFQYDLEKKHSTY